MTFDLKAYAARIDYCGEMEPTLHTLTNLHLAHATHIPFENLDILLGRPIRIDLESIWAKLVAGRRGGYCFEQNTLFAAVLEAIGFRVTRLAARVRMGVAAPPRPRSHMLLGVDLEAERYLADVGFGSGLMQPIPHRLGEVSRQFAWSYRVREDGAVNVLQTMTPEGWMDLHSFTFEKQSAVDYEVANYYTSTNPHSPFVNRIVVARVEPEVRWMLLNRQLLEITPDGRKATIVPDDDALLEVLADRFEVSFPSGTRFKYDGGLP